MADIDEQVTKAINGDLAHSSSDTLTREPSKPVGPQMSEVATPASKPAAPPTLSEDELAILAKLADSASPEGLPSWEEELQPMLFRRLVHNVYRFVYDQPTNAANRTDIPKTTFGLVFRGFAPRGPPSPRNTTVRLPVLLEGEALQKEVDKLRSMLEEFDEGPPFTIQRLAELLLHPFHEHHLVGKYLRAVQRVLSVASSFDPQVYAPLTNDSQPVASSSTAAATPSTPFQLASTPLYSPIPFLRGRELPVRSPRKNSSPPLSPLDIVPRRSPNTSPRGSPRMPARRGGPRVATSAMSMAAQTRKRANSLSSSSSPAVLSPTIPSPSDSKHSLPEAFTLSLPTPELTPSGPGSGSQKHSLTPPPISPPMGPSPTRVDELDNPESHKLLLAEPVALSSVTTGRVKVRSPELKLAEMAAILDVIHAAKGSARSTSEDQPVTGLGLSLGERFVPSSVEEEKPMEETQDVNEGNEGTGSNGSGEAEEGEVERMVSEEREMEVEDLPADEDGWEVVQMPEKDEEMKDDC
ncbi:hypothetical protein DACRYDRAFT_118180 [Dacryopinax primogenitus]|uniref:PPP4R2-domain-containing protein n=1 Tax=Dacryopinax primogenitus (strain DJM 731) TaxID=1858805 RepID=M5FTT5_DACPD|nr:uncharacterized protein DACRYDRAFT_118180 [Dacryopinax primogenitus]EJT98859.1 hypothetical protein DACRYDRAFT_118180 [Dacryopinax primogenitus]